MATTVKEFLEDREKTIDTITTRELEIVEKYECYIDEKIIPKYIDTLNDDIKIDLCVAQFRYDPITNTMTNYTETSRNRMFKELTRRYKNAGWKIKTFIDTSGFINEQDFWILKIK